MLLREFRHGYGDPIEFYIFEEHYSYDVLVNNYIGRRVNVIMKFVLIDGFVTLSSVEKLRKSVTY